MGERKVLNKYYPADFDPAKIPRRRQPKNQQMTVRTMLAMSIRCRTCGIYIYKGTKFNCRKEVVVGDAYLGIQIIRFYFKCSNCSSEITLVTDPQNSDYAVESGASRNFEPWHADGEAREEEMGDAIKSLENTALDSKRDMDIVAALDELKSMKSRRAAVTADAMLEALQRDDKERSKMEEAEAEAYIRAVFLTRRIDDQDLELDTSSRPLKRRNSKQGNTDVNGPSVKFSIIKKPDAQDDVMQSLFQQYGSDGEDC